MKCQLYPDLNKLSDSERRHDDGHDTGDSWDYADDCSTCSEEDNTDAGRVDSRRAFREQTGGTGAHSSPDGARAHRATSSEERREDAADDQQRGNTRRRGAESGGRTDDGAICSWKSMGLVALGMVLAKFSFCQLFMIALVYKGAKWVFGHTRICRRCPNPGPWPSWWYRTPWGGHRFWRTNYGCHGSPRGRSRPYFHFH